MSVSDWLFNPSGLTPHGFCLLWVPGLIAVHAISDGVIALAYFSIPLALAAFAEQRKDLEYKWVIHLFVAFILACGTTHLMSIVTLWWPVYGIEGIIKAITAILSIATAGLLWPLIPKLVALPSPRELRAVNVRLAEKIHEHEQTAERLRESEALVRQSNEELERRVEERTKELQVANGKLSEALAQRDLLLQEVYHRVKNNLQIVDSMVDLQARRLTDPDAKTGLKSLRSRVHALGLVHQQLMGSGDMRTFDVSPFLTELSENLAGAGGGENIKISVQAIPLEVNLDFGIPLGLIVTELVTNSLKHAFPGGAGHIEVSLNRLQDGTIVLVVGDDGIGTGAAQNNSAAKSSGLGSTIINGFVSQLRAKMTSHGSLGSRIEILFPNPGLG